MTYSDIISEVAKSLGLPEKMVDRTYRAYWRVVRKHIIALPLKEELSEMEFKALQPNVNIPSIGKLNVTYDRYRRMKKYNSRITNIKQNKDATYKED